MITYVYESIKALQGGDYSLKFENSEVYESKVGGWLIITKDKLEFVFPKDTILIIDKGDQK